MQTLEDKELISHYLIEKNPAYLGEFFGRHTDLAFRLAMKMMRNQADAEDMVQLSYIKIYKNLANYQESDNAKAWFMKILINNCKDKMKANMRRLKREEKAPTNKRKMMPDEDESELQDKVQELVSAMPDKYRLPLWLRLFEEMPFKEISQVLNIPQKTARTQVDRGMEKLRSTLMKFGYSMSVAAIINVCMQTELQAAPTILTELCNSPDKIIRNSSNISQRLAYSSKPTISITTMLISGFSIAAIALIAFNFFTHNNDFNKPKQITNLSWNFEGSNALNNITPIKNKLNITNHGQQNKALKIKQATMLVIDRQQISLPLKISGKMDVKCQNSHFQSSIGLLFREVNQKIYFFKNLAGEYRLNFYSAQDGEYYSKQAKKMIDFKFHVTDTYIEYFVNNKRNTITIFDKKVSNTQELLFFFNKNIILDDIKIEPVPTSELKKVKKFISIKSIHSNTPADNKPISLKNSAHLKGKRYDSASLLIIEFNGNIDEYYLNLDKKSKK